MELGKLENQAALPKQRSSRTAREPEYQVNVGPEKPRSIRPQLKTMSEKDCSGELEEHPRRSAAVSVALKSPKTTQGSVIEIANCSV
ncbi:hypothetical protein V6N13_065011 [Hibiscus sabdariffa]